MRPAAEVEDALLRGPTHRFADPIAPEVPDSGAGIYTVWDEGGKFVYVGIAGRSPSGNGLATRLKSHRSGRRSGDQFCVYVADQDVLPGLTPQQVEAISTAQLSIDGLVRERVASLSFRYAVLPDYKAAAGVEQWFKSGQAPCGPPRLNPVRSRRPDG